MIIQHLMKKYIFWYFQIDVLLRYVILVFYQTLINYEVENVRKNTKEGNF